MTDPSGPSQSGRLQLLEKSQTLLGWERIQASLARHACSPVTETRCLELMPEPDFAVAQNALRETAELVNLLSSGESFPIQNFEDLRPLFDEARRRHILEPGHCLHVLKLARLSRNLRKALEAQEEFPLLQTKGLSLDPLTKLLAEIQRCVDDDGEIKESASPELEEAIREVAQAKQKLERRIGKLFSSSEYKNALQDTYFTEREERLVLPVRAEYRSKVEGIVHDSSGSGQTLFMEPTSIIPLNNQLKISKLRVEQEKLRILRALTRAILEAEDPLVQNLDLLTDLDLIHARARLGQSMQANKCPMNQNGRLKLVQARNPELLLDGRPVVPNSLSWEESIRVIIISGPNTGGKTVTLKTIGLMSLMARAGLFLPVEEGSEIPFFNEIYADIGDDQNVQLNLSTFSAHLDKIIHILNHAPPGALILLDELGIATDPQEGASLAEAVLIELQRKNVMTLVSTHYLSLKTLAQTRPGFLNACTEFDSESLAPTYRLIFGAPGHSAALDTAQRLGLDAGVIQKARVIYDEKDHRADTLLKDLTDQKLALEKELEDLRIKQEEVERLKQERESLVERLKAERYEFQKTRVQKLQSTVRDARNQIKKMVRDLKETKDPRKLRQAEKKIQEMTRAPRAPLRKTHPDWDVPPDQLRPGDSVIVEALGRTGILLDFADKKKKVRVKIGNLTSLVDLYRLRGQRGGAPKPAPAAIKIQVHAETTSRPQTSCDLRGMIADEAMNAMEAFLSQALVHNISRVTIIHGHGTGTLKKLVREYLETSGLCKSFSGGARESGGDGVTLVDL